MTSIFGMLGVDLTAPDHTTLSRRGQHLALALRRARPGTSLHLIVDSTGLSIVGDGEWAAAKHGGRGRRGWRKLHLGVDGSRGIVACALTEPTADDAITGISLVDEVDGHLTRVTADPAYDTRACYGAAGARGARVVVPPTKTASLSRRGARSGARDRTIRRVKALGRRRWKKASGYHQHARVENAFFRYTSHPRASQRPAPMADDDQLLAVRLDHAGRDAQPLGDLEGLVPGNEDAVAVREHRAAGPILTQGGFQQGPAPGS